MSTIIIEFQSTSLPLGVSIIDRNHLAIIGAKSSNVGTFTCVINKNGHQAASKTNVTIISGNLFYVFVRNPNLLLKMSC